MLAHSLLEVLILSPSSFSALLSVSVVCVGIHMDRETHVHMLLLIYTQDFLTTPFENVTHVPLIVKRVVTDQHVLFFTTGLEKTLLIKPWVRERLLNKLKIYQAISQYTTNRQKAVKNVCRDILAQSCPIYLRASLF